eukprot:scaffold49691_cov337-Isochrysis_galbana.AAC.1
MEGRRAARAKVFFSFVFIMRCPGRHRAVPTTGSGGPCAGPQVPVPTLWPNLVVMSPGVFVYLLFARLVGTRPLQPLSLVTR